MYMYLVLHICHLHQLFIDLTFYRNWFFRDDLETLRGKKIFFVTFKPLTLKSDQCLISPYNITPESHSEVTQTKKMITKPRKLLINNQILLVIIQGNIQV